MWMEYLERVCIFLLIAETMLRLCPSSKYERYVRMVTGLICMAMILLPLTTLLQTDGAGELPRIEAFEQELRKAMEEGEKQMEKELDWQIEEGELSGEQNVGEENISRIIE